jgi:hypothetical protein
MTANLNIRPSYQGTRDGGPLQQLTRRSRFTRIWTRQELLLPKGAMFICVEKALSEVDYSRLTTMCAINLCWQISLGWFQFTDTCILLRFHQRSCNLLLYGLSFKRFGIAQVPNPGTKLLRCIGFYINPGLSLPQAFYSKSVREVYTDRWRRVLKAGGAAKRLRPQSPLEKSYVTEESRVIVGVLRAVEET